MNAYDLLIIGGGVCGMTAGIYAARANLNVCILEKEVCGGLVNWTNTVENFPSYPSIHGEELMDKCRAHVESLGVNIQEIDGVAQVDLIGPIKQVTTQEGEQYQARAVIIASGRHPIPLPVPTEFPQVHYCSVCDGSAYRGKDVLVVGGGNSGFDEALFLAELGVRHIHIIEALPQCNAAAATRDKALAGGKIRVSTCIQLTALEPMPSGKATVHLQDTATGQAATEEVDGVFCFIGQTPSTTAFAGVVDMDDQGYIKTNPDMETNLPGVFAAGDVIVKKYRQITTAMGDGTIAALQAVHYLHGR